MTIHPLLFALLMWFIGTASIVWLDSRPRSTFRTSMRLSGLAAIAAIILVWYWADDTGSTGAFVGFGAAIVIWGWHEMSFLMGFVAGPNKEPCPPGATGWPRFKAATATVRTQSTRADGGSAIGRLALDDTDDIPTPRW